LSTPYHAKFLAHELTRRAEFGSPEMFARALSDAQVDLNPHQVDAALFAARSPISKGVILADEVGLGKTIEAALLLAQRWAERRRRLLIIVPANLRKQWSQELQDKFHLPSLILERQSMQMEVAKGNFNAFEQKERIVIISYPFAAKNAHYIKAVQWDMVVIDEAHRLRNVYRKNVKNANIIKDAVAERFKVLLTATPLQNSLLELYGLVSIIDEFHFGSLDGFKQRYSKPGANEASALKERLGSISKRTLRADVRHFVRFTERKALVQEFVPSDDEHRLYEEVSAYLLIPRLFALPSQQRQLMTMVLRKLLASSTFAIANTLNGLVERLEQLIERSKPVDAAPAELVEDVENFDETAEEWEDEDQEDEEGDGKRETVLAPFEIAAARRELEQLKLFRDLALQIRANSKGAALITALRAGFDMAQDAQRGASALQRKAIIFTESRRTQDYLRELLESDEAGFRGKIVLFNGTNSDPGSKEIYEQWLRKNAGSDRISNSKTADMRAALVDRFRDGAEIMIATEAAAEGINLQFCNLVVNYDLPWNPQRVEQRIGRCHRYGQKCDVVVVNFVNRKNAADRRVYELLQSKFQLFQSVFGASDQVLGQVDPTGFSFEKRIHEILQTCRSGDEIDRAFKKLEKELETEITQAKTRAREDLMNNFDQSVVEKVKVGAEKTLAAVERKLWRLTRHLLDSRASFDEKGHAFTLSAPVLDAETTPAGRYVLHRSPQEAAHFYRIGHPLALHLIDMALSAPTPTAEVEFMVSAHSSVLAAIKPLVGKSGWLDVTRIAHVFKDGQTEDHVLVVAECDDGATLEPDVAVQLFECEGRMSGSRTKDPTEATRFRLSQFTNREGERLFNALRQRSQTLLKEEMGKLDAWEEDQKADARSKLEELQDKLKQLNKTIALCTDFAEELSLQEDKTRLRILLDREEARVRSISDDIGEKRLNIIQQKKSMLTAKQDVSMQFRIRWRAV
jgi:superfamily II DNA/RNA helicase